VESHLFANLTDPAVDPSSKLVDGTLVLSVHPGQQPWLSFAFAAVPDGMAGRRTFIVVPFQATPLELSEYEYGKRPTGRVYVSPSGQLVEFWSDAKNTPTGSSCGGNFSTLNGETPEYHPQAARKEVEQEYTEEAPSNGAPTPEPPSADDDEKENDDQNSPRPKSKQVVGVIAKLIRSGVYGFIEYKGEEIFFHKSEVAPEDMVVGVEVNFHLEEDPNKEGAYKATRLKRRHGASKLAQEAKTHAEGQQDLKPEAQDTQLHHPHAQHAQHQHTQHQHAYPQHQRELHQLHVWQQPHEMGGMGGVNYYHHPPHYAHQHAHHHHQDQEGPLSPRRMGFGWVQ